MIPRQLKIRRGLLQALAAIPPGYLLPEAVLMADTRRVVLPYPMVSEFEEALNACDIARLIVGIDSDEGRKWQISDAGRAWLAEHG